MNGFFHNCQLHNYRYIQVVRRFSVSRIRKWQTFENERHYEPGEDIRRAWHGLTYDFRRSARRYREAKYDAFRRKYPIAHMKKEPQNYELLPFHTEFLIIGGGLCGSSAAYWLKQGFRDENFTVTVVESTENFAKSRSMLGSGAISQQFSIPEFVDLALYSAEFFRHAGEHLKILDNDPPDLNLLPVGFMHLARTQEEAKKLNDAWKIQVERGAHVALWGPEELKRKFPFMNFDDVVLGTYGLENEGIIDTWQLLSALREKNIILGVRYVKAEVEGVWHGPVPINKPATWGAMPNDEADRAADYSHQLAGAIVRPQMTGASARPIRCYQMLNAAGPWSGEIARLAGIGTRKGVFSVPVPIICTRRTHFLVHAPDVPAVHMPALFDPSGIFCHQDNVGHNFICGRRPTKADAVKMGKDEKDPEPPIDYNEFFDTVWPTLVKRVPSFESAKVINAWHSYEDINTFDDVPILGEHFCYRNFYQMCGLGGFGSQLSLALGKAYSEKMLDCAYTTTNVRSFDMRRIMMGKRHEEPLKCV